MKLHCLIIEDEAALVELLRYNFEQEGFRVSAAADGEEALVMVSEDAPDIVILDWMLPLMSGSTCAASSGAGPRRAIFRSSC